MSGGFSFGFSGGDDSDDELQSSHENSSTTDEHTNGGTQTIPPQKHDIDSLIDALPDQIAYNTITITSPSGKTICLPRRELFDIRVQLMAEDESNDPNLLSGLSDDSDIRTNIYEGGFKTWECSVDLVKFLLDRAPDGVNQYIELGAGTALPSLTLFHTALSKVTPLSLTITDYNPTVLTHSTLPNLLLTYASTLPADSLQFTIDQPNPLASSSEFFQPSGSLEITPSLLANFKAHLNYTVHLTLLSGSWTPPVFLDMLPPLDVLPPPVEASRTMVLASETIYSPAALESFTEVLSRLLEQREGSAIVAAKKVYFGVGGSVDAFREEASRKGMLVGDVEFEGLGTTGVRRCLLEVSAGHKG